jgi:hypothetical protein
MADFVHVNPQIEMGGEVYRALRDIGRGVAKLQELHDLKNEAIAKGPATMMSVFGTNTEPEAQILSDRWGALIAALDGDVPAWAAADPYALLRDLTTNTLRAN